MFRCRLVLQLSLGISLVGALTVVSAPPGTRPVDGLREHTPSVHTLTNARLVIAPGRIMERGTIVVRDGVITAAGADVSAPADARTWDLSGKTIYPGLIDAYAEMPANPPAGGAGYWNALVTPHLNLAEQYKTDASLNEKLRGQGIVARLVAPASGVIKGESGLVTTGKETGEQSILRAGVALHMRLGVPRGRGREGYPGSPMGAVALARQALHDAAWYTKAWAAHQANSSLPRPERNDALAALQKYLDGQRLVLIDGANELYFLRADSFAREFSLHTAIRGSGQEYQRLDAVRATGRTVIVPINFPKPPNVNSPEAARETELEDLLHWDIAPENPARLVQAGVTIALTSNGLRDIGEFLGAVRTAVERGLAPDAALRALTTNPAELFGVADRLGTLEAGKAASLIVTDGDLFAKKTKVLETWVDGQRYEVEKKPPIDPRGKWQLNIAAEGQMKTYELTLTGSATQLQGSIVIPKPENKTEEVKLSKLELRDTQLTGTMDAKAFEKTGVAQFSALIIAPPEGTPAMSGSIVWPDGSQVGFSAARTAGPSPEFDKPADEPKKEEPKNEGAEAADKKDDTQKPNTQDDKTKEDEKKKAEKPKIDPRASFAVNFPLGAFGRTTIPEQPQQILLKNATIWTCGPQGVLPKASVLIGGGKILSVSAELTAPADATVVDLSGKHISPGIIDCHSHMATDGGVNESTQAITAEVRIGDFIDCNDIDIYRQLAGGVTSANILHGSANPIGGQNQVIKLRWGALSDEMKFVEAPPGIKFALGENVKQSNWGDNFATRYPQSRMGVEQIIRDAFQAARDYRQAWQRWEQKHDTLPPRRDLELETLLEILDGKRWIHCHSYRQDEILALLRTCEEFNIRIATLQHILEGYKVADAMARHNAMGSSFSDWWAYKIEVFDAIPYNGALMHQAGVVVSFNSDDQELARHLNHEAAKAVKYGNVPPEEALKFVTLNPAKQLRIDQFVGSLDPGKYADLVVWSGPPLAVVSRCEQTWIDGRKYFDIAEDKQQREEARKIRNTLVQKILASGQAMKTPEESKKPDEELWPREDEFCHGGR